MGVRVILAESFNPAYEKSLIQIGILPLRLETSAKELGLTGRETLSFEFADDENENESERCREKGAVSHLVRVRLDDGRAFGACARFRSDEVVGRALDDGFFARSAGKLLAGAEGR